MIPENRPKILIVDDMIQNLGLLQKILEPYDYEIFIAKDGLKAIEITKKIEPDLILLDILMPEIDGFKVCESITSFKSKKNKEIPIIFLTAVNDLDTKIKAFEVGGVDYITKPFDPKEVIIRVKTHLVNGFILNSFSKLIKKTFDELYTPLSVIETGVELQSLEYGNTEYLDNIKSSARSLQNIYDDIYYILEKKDTQSEKIYIELNKYINSRIKYFNVVAKAKNMNFKFTYPSNSVYIIFIDKNKLQRVIDNTISNAVKYGFANSTILIDLNIKNSLLELNITNSGREIKNIKNIFKDFYKEKKKKNKLGIGLDIVYNITQEENIKMDVVSKNKKTSFIYKFKDFK